MKINKQKLESRKQKGFTIIEIIVSITIFSIILISMITIYILSNDTSSRSDATRAMHENLKSVITEIGEDVIKNGIKRVSDNLDECDLNSTTNYQIGTKLCTNSLNEYYLANKDMGRVFDKNYCNDINNQCYIVKNGVQLTNTLVSIKDLEFFVSSVNVNKVTIKIVLQPTLKSGIRSNLIENSELLFQTTISERPF